MEAGTRIETGQGRISLGLSLGLGLRLGLCLGLPQGLVSAGTCPVLTAACLAEQV